MNFTAVFPDIYLLNLSRREDRRARCAQLFAAQGWQVKRQPAVDARRLDSARGFEAPGRYAHAVSTRMILRRAALNGADTVFIFEDDVVLHPDFVQRLGEITLPDDWGIFYAGCQHHERPEPVGPGLVRATAPLDTHAWGVRAPYFHEVRRALRGAFWPERDGPLPNADILLAELVRRVPAYAAYPNLAWQQEEISDLAGGTNGNYDTDGTQHHAGGCLRGVMAEVLGGTAHPPAAAEARGHRAFMWPVAWPRTVLSAGPVTPPVPEVVREPEVTPLTPDGKVAFLFLTRDVHQNPDMWAEYWAGQEARVAVFAHATQRGYLKLPGRGGWLQAAQITEHFPDAGEDDLPMVRAQLALLRAALTNSAHRFFVFVSAGCVPARPLGELLRLLALDGRSRFASACFDDVVTAFPERAARYPSGTRIPRGQWRFHSPWLLLSREAAELLVANGALLDGFAGQPHAATFVPGTLLQAAGYPLALKVAAQNVTWEFRPAPHLPGAATVNDVTVARAGDIAGSGCFFARKFGKASPVRNFGLHLPA